jgi:hypothetical protein
MPKRCCRPDTPPLVAQQRRWILAAGIWLLAVVAALMTFG